MSDSVVDLLDRKVYGFRQVDRVLGLKGGTTARWVDGYSRGGRRYDPVVRSESTGRELVTWGEFVEVRLLAEFRDTGVPMIRLRPTVQRLREELGIRYPLAHASSLLTVEGREVVRRIQQDDEVPGPLTFVVVRSGQVAVDLAPPPRAFVDAVQWDDGAARTLRPIAAVPDVVCDPLRAVGEPTVDGVLVDALTEQFRVAERLEGIAETYDLTVEQVAAAVRYELVRAGRASSAA